VPVSNRAVGRGCRSGDRCRAGFRGSVVPAGLRKRRWHSVRAGWLRGSDGGKRSPLPGGSSGGARCSHCFRRNHRCRRIVGGVGVAAAGSGGSAGCPIDGGPDRDSHLRGHGPRRNRDYGGTGHRIFGHEIGAWFRAFRTAARVVARRHRDHGASPRRRRRLRCFCRTESHLSFRRGRPLGPQRVLAGGGRDGCPRTGLGHSFVRVGIRTAGVEFDIEGECLGRSRSCCGGGSRIDRLRTSFSRHTHGCCRPCRSGRSSWRSPRRRSTGA
jgi:hypothetical protein